MDESRHADFVQAFLQRVAKLKVGNGLDESTTMGPLANSRRVIAMEHLLADALMMNGNLDFTEWDQAFPSNPLLASATLDRFRHNAYCLTLDGQSYRTPRQMPTTAATKTKNSVPQKDAK